MQVQQAQSSPASTITYGAASTPDDGALVSTSIMCVGETGCRLFSSQKCSKNPMLQMMVT